MAFERDGEASLEPANRVARPHLAWLDGLRGIAILLVVLIHSSLSIERLPTWLSDASFYGVRGVQLFFIVSGYTLTVTHAGRPLALADFALRRFLRIAPMFYIGAALYLLLAATTDAPIPSRQATMFDVMVTLVFLHGWFPSAINTVVPGGWSIAAEAMFYITFPVVVIVLRRQHLINIVLAASYALAGLTNLILRKVIGGSLGEALAFPFWLVQWPAFVSGCWLTMVVEKYSLPRRYGTILLTIVIIGLAIDSQLRGRSNLLVAIALLTLLTYAVGVRRPTILEGGLLPWLGKISFSIYIIHFAVIAALRPAAGVVAAAVGPTSTLAAMVVLTVVFTAPLAALAWRYIEMPFVQLAKQIGIRSKRQLTA